MDKDKVLLVLHGKQAGNEEVRAAVAAQREAGRELAVRVTWEDGDARRIVEEALAAGYATLVAGGGDGTLREVAEALARGRGEARRAWRSCRWAPPTISPAPPGFPWNRPRRWRCSTRRRGRSTWAR